MHMRDGNAILSRKDGVMTYENMTLLLLSIQTVISLLALVVLIQQKK